MSLLFIDETGDFRNKNERVVLAGVCIINMQNSKDIRDAILELISDAFPNVPFPPHATDMNYSSSWPSLPRRPYPREYEFLDQILSQGHNTYRSSKKACKEHDLYTAWLTCVVKRWAAAKKPDYDAIKLIAGVLRRSGDRDERIRAIETLRKTGSVLADRMLEKLFATPHVIPLVAVETCPGSAGRKPRQRYENLTKGLSSLLNDRVSNADATEWHVASVPWYNNKRKLTRDQQRTAQRKYMQDNVLGSAHFVYAYDQKVHPGIVLADLFANRLGRALRGRNSYSWNTWDKVSKSITSVTHADVNKGGKPLVIAVGDCDEAEMPEWTEDLPRFGL